jgi:hypothetical protein
MSYTRSFTTVPFTEAEWLVLSEHGYERQDDGAVAHNGYRKVVKKADNLFIRYSWMEDDEGGSWEEWGNDHSTLDFL